MALTNNDDNEHFNNNFYIKVATTEDAKAIRGMIQELANFEKMPKGPEIGSDQLAKDIICGNVYVLICYCKSNDEPAAMNLYYHAYSSWQGQFIHMEDLYVRPNFRRQGLAKRLVIELAKIAHSRNIKRIQWDVLNWNENAKAFYQKINAIDLNASEGWIQYRLNAERIAHLVIQK